MSRYDDSNGVIVPRPKQDTFSPDFLEKMARAADEEVKAQKARYEQEKRDAEKFWRNYETLKKSKTYAERPDGTMYSQKTEHDAPRESEVTEAEWKFKEESEDAPKGKRKGRYKDIAKGIGRKTVEVGKKAGKKGKEIGEKASAVGWKVASEGYKASAKVGSAAVKVGSATGSAAKAVSDYIEESNERERRRQKKTKARAKERREEAMQSEEYQRFKEWERSQSRRQTYDDDEDVPRRRTQTRSPGKGKRTTSRKQTSVRTPKRRSSKKTVTRKTTSRKSSGQKPRKKMSDIDRWAREGIF